MLFRLSIVFVFVCSFGSDRVVANVRPGHETTPLRLRRFVHRHACVGIDGVDGDSGDSIACSTSTAAAFDHVLTPSKLWCNNVTCISEFNETFEVHTIVCTPHSCAVTLHCEEALEQIKYALLFTLASIFVFAALPLERLFARIVSGIDSFSIALLTRRRGSRSKNN